MAYLKVLLYGQEINTIKLDQSKVYHAGRNPVSEIALDNKSGISRQHFKIFFDANIWKVEIISKFASLKYKGEEVTKIDLSENCIFTVSPYDFSFILKEKDMEIQGMEKQDLLNQGIESQETEDLGNQKNNKLEEKLEDIANAQINNSENLDDLQNSQNDNLEVANFEQNNYENNYEVSSENNVFEQNEQESTFLGNNEVTYIDQKLLGIPYLKIERRGYDDENYKLEGVEWLIGRDNTCDIVLKDSKISRKQLEISEELGKYYIKDLGSINGTILNGEKLASNTKTVINSGDLINILDYNIYFEIRDPNFIDKVNQIDPNIINQTPSLEEPLEEPLEESLEDDNGNVSDSLFDSNFSNNLMLGNAPAPQYPDHYNQGVMLPGNLNEQYWSTPDKSLSQTRKKFRFFLFFLVVIIGLFIYFKEEQKKQLEKKIIAEKIEKENDPLGHLTVEQKNMLKNTYTLAKRFYMQGKYELAATEIIKVHQLVDSYEDSREIEEHCRQAFEIKKQQEMLAQQKKEQLELEQKVKSVIAECDRQKSKITSVDEMQKCLHPAVELDPENPKFEELILYIVNRENAKKNRKVKKQAKKRKIQKYRKIYERAENLKNRGEYYQAINKYKNFINSPYNQSDGLKEKANREIASITSNLKSKIENIVAKGDSQYKEGKLKAAYYTYNGVYKYKGDHSEIEKKQKNIANELTRKLQPIYQDSVFDEDLGNLKLAKEKWQTIIDTDIKEGKYYNKARIKMKKYGSF